MATIGATALTLADWASRLDPDGVTAKIVEILKQTNEILDDMLWIEGNLPTGHRHTIRGGLPTPTWRMLNYGVPVSKSLTKQVDDVCGILSDYGEVDKDLADLNGNTASFRLTEDAAHIMGMSNELASTLFYGNTGTDPEKFVGLAPRFNDLSADNSENILNAAGSGSDNTSIWLVVWDAMSCAGIFPKGSKAGLTNKDLGEVTAQDSSNNYFQAYRTFYEWKPGMIVPDWRYVVRIANIDVSDLKKDAASGADLVDLMVQALEIPPSLNMGRAVFYCNKTIRSFLRRQMLNHNNVFLSLNEVAGKHVLAFDTVPVKRCDAILNTEAVVS